jgi:hypothetical protein
MSEPTAPDSNTIVSHEQDGRVLSGMGADAEQLAETMERHAPPEKPDAPKGTAATGTAADGVPSPATPAAPVSRGRQRFADLTKERDTAREETAKERGERERLEARVRELETPRPAAQPVAAEPAKPKAAEPTRPEPTEDEIGVKYQTYAEFARDLSKWVLEQHVAAQQQTDDERINALLDQREAEREFVSTARASQDRGRKAYPDFDALLKGPAGKVPLGPNESEAVQRAQFVISHPQSEHIQYAILKDETLARKLQQASAMEFGVIVAGLVPAAAPARPAWTPPPAPHPTVGASSPTTATPSAEMAKKGDFDGYRAKRAAERGVKSRF